MLHISYTYWQIGALQIGTVVPNKLAKMGFGDWIFQAWSKQELHTHFNVALTAVSLAKVAYYSSLSIEKRGSFSMVDIKMMHMNQLMSNRIFENLDFDLSEMKIKQLYEQCLNFGRFRA